MKRSIKYFLISAVLFFYACSSSIRYTSTEKNEINRSESKYLTESQTGVASYYADEFNGKKTASGEIYNMNKLTAAHPSYPFGTIVKVTNLKNGKIVVVRINDRMPDFKNRIIDLSYEAAKQINMINEGIQEVELEVIEWGE